MRSLATYLILPLFSVLVLFSCSKKDDPVAPTQGGTQPVGEGAVKLEFFNNVGGSALNLNNQWYKNEHGDSFKVSKFNYYISNIKLNGTNEAYVEKESYHLLQQDSASSLAFDLTSVSAGTYTSITFTIGVDSLRNVSGAQKGALDPTNGMFWSWNTGYIMLKLEGTSPKSNITDHQIIFHAGGFSGVNSVVRTMTLTFPNPIIVTMSGVNHIHLTADVLSLFKSPNVIDFASLPVMNTPGADAKKIADNYANMFTVTYAGL